MTKPMMKCGHAANAVEGKTGKPSCVICVGIHPGAMEIDDSPPDLSKRKARCLYHGSIPRGGLHESNYGCKRGEACNCERPSDSKLPFFEHRPNREHDAFYCGCWGWD